MFSSGKEEQPCQLIMLASHSLSWLLFKHLNSMLFYIPSVSPQDTALLKTDASGPGRVNTKNILKSITSLFLYIARVHTCRYGKYPFYNTHASISIATQWPYRAIFMQLHSL